MISPIKNPAIAGLVLMLSACATPYKEKGLTGGYNDFEAQPGVYYVSFEGNRQLGKDGAVKYWHRRASEICPSGYEVLKQSDGGDQFLAAAGNVVGIVTKPRIEGYIRCN